MIVAVIELGKVAVQVFLTTMLIDAFHATLENFVVTLPRTYS